MYCTEPELSKRAVQKTPRLRKSSLLETRGNFPTVDSRKTFYCRLEENMYEYMKIYAASGMTQ